MTRARIRVSPAAALQRFEPFSALSAKGKAILAQGTTVSDCEVGAGILHKGEPVSGAYVVLQGRLRVFTIGPNGTEATLYFVEPGEACVLALNCLFNDHPVSGLGPGRDLRASRGGARRGLSPVV